MKRLLVVSLTVLLLAGCAATRPPATAVTEPAPSSAASPAITPQPGGGCNILLASWSPMLSSTGIKVLTNVAGHQIVSITTAAGTTTTIADAPAGQLPYSIEVAGVTPASVNMVQLTSTDPVTSSCVVPREPGS